MHGTVFDIQRFSVHDGPGIRTTVFLKGCPLRCRWCHNPESLDQRPQLAFDAERCIGCGRCVRACPNDVHRPADGNHIIDRAACRLCGVCVRDCPARALEIVGRDLTVNEVLGEVLKDQAFYGPSGGGLTISGGEPLMQPTFTEEILRSAKERAGLHCCLDTCGHAPKDRLERVRPYVDLFLYDVKETDSNRHKTLTGVPNEQILANLELLHDSGARIIVRLPLIAGLNDSAEHFAGVAELATRMPHLDGFEVMPYHRLGEGKLRRIGGDDHPARYHGESTPAQTVKLWIDRLAALGVPVLNEIP